MPVELTTAERVNTAHRTSLAELNALFATSQPWAFSGELSATRESKVDKS
jgi:hypothetical protein